MQAQKADLSQAVTEAAQMVHGMKMFGEEGSNKYIGAVSRLKILRQELGDVEKKSAMLRAFYKNAQKERQNSIAADIKRIRHSLADGGYGRLPGEPHWLDRLGNEANKSTDAQIAFQASLNVPVADIQDARVEQIKQSAYQNVKELHAAFLDTSDKSEVEEMKHDNAIAEKLWVNDPETKNEPASWGP